MFQQKWISCSLVLVFTLFFGSLVSADDVLPHEFSAGDVISADVLNEMFESVSPKAGKLSEVIIGTWTTQSWHYGLDDPDSPGEGTLTINSLTDITYEGNVSLAGVTSTGQHIFSNDENPVTILRISIIENIVLKIVMQRSDEEIVTNICPVLKLTANKIVLKCPYPEGIEVLTRTNPSPAKPSSLSASVTNHVVSLTWTDNSSDETGFKILRKSSIKGGFNVITTTGADVTLYEDTVIEAGRYWYRVIATNANGDSIGTKVIKVIVMED